MIVQTQTDKTGMVRGQLFGPALSEMRQIDGLDRGKVVKHLTRYGKLWGMAFSQHVDVQDGGDL